MPPPDVLPLNMIVSPNAAPDEFFGLGRGLEARARLKMLAAIIDKLPTKVDVLKQKIVNRFQGNTYARECHIAKGYFGVGAIHKLPHICIISKGKILVADHLGERLIEAPATFVSEAGIQRAGLCLEDTIWTTIHEVGDSINEDSTEKEIRAVLTCKDYNDTALPLTIEGELL